MANNFVFLAGWLHLEGEQGSNDLGEYVITHLDVASPSVGGRIRVLFAGDVLDKFRTIREALPNAQKVQVALTGRLVSFGEHYIVVAEQLHVAFEAAEP